MTGGKPTFYRSQAVSESGGRASFEKQVTLLLETKPPCFTNRHGLILRLLKPRTAHVIPYGLPLLETRGRSVRQPSAGPQRSRSPRPAARLSTSARLRRRRGRADRLVCAIAVKRCRASGTPLGCGRRRPSAAGAGGARPGPSARWLQVRGSRRGSGRGRPPQNPRRPRSRRRWPVAPWGRR